jgi:hypothetical protein
MTGMPLKYLGAPLDNPRPPGACWRIRVKGVVCHHVDEFPDGRIGVLVAGPHAHYDDESLAREVARKMIAAGWKDVECVRAKCDGSAVVETRLPDGTTMREWRKA